ncbi:50S ribosomal protein L25 [Anaerococcus sp. NML200574]|uniref:50S ribosomal protein L25 n=1 Tax=unclassified Anaerococcus TaxID=2614126 RepID=UPI000D0AFA3D|nr:MULTISPECIES: 50S ribosomal protein L25 [unclassified Anaerococcus]MCW6677915.1 50S ribosomal protein L25 [Anaerococcus sp. NML200574]MCW6702327.1 50S ribosomal protein L25 [Anaerococcus sp. NML200537]
MANLVLQAEKREATGKNKVNKLRSNELIPGVVYAKNQENVNVQFEAREFDKVLRQAGTSTIITLDVNGEGKEVLIKDFQTHPYKNQFLHVDFQAIDQNQAIRVTVPVNLIGRDDLNADAGVLVQNIDVVEVECLPKYIPQTADVEIKDLQIGENKTVADLDIFKDENINVLADAEEVICSLQEVSEEEIIDDEEEAADAADVPTVDETEESEDNE